LLVDYKKPPKLPCVPQQAVVDLSTGSRCVWVLKDDMTVEQRVIETREMSDGWIPVDKGLSIGDKVIVSGMSKLAPGMKVVLAEATGNEDLDPSFKPRIKE
jgi:multidrug efflux pump subunit AcrA (membrane-fusion protein)